MSEGKLTMFGKTYNSVGSTDSNFVIKTKGDLKIQWGGKFIDLIKDGKIASGNSNLFNVIDSKEDISGNGIYLIAKEDGSEVWVSIDGNDINIAGEVGTTYVSFAKELETTPELKAIAIKNIGLSYETLEDAKKSGIVSGMVYIEAENKIYLVKNSQFTDINLDKENSESILPIGEITINGITSAINGANKLLLTVGDIVYIVLDKNITISKPLIIDPTSYIESYNASRGLTGTGFSIYMLGLQSILEVDTVIARNGVKQERIKAVSYMLLVKLLQDDGLVAEKEYKIRDFQNEWEVCRLSDIILTDIYETTETFAEGSEPLSTLITPKNVRPLIVKAMNPGLLYAKCYFEDYPDWVAEYDIDYYELITTIDEEEIYSKGRITKLTDTNNNSCNYDFKHLKFLVDGKKLYTFDTGEGIDNSSNVHDNIVILLKPILESELFGIILGTNDGDKAIFTGVNIFNNKFYNIKGSLIINTQFINNTFQHNVLDLTVTGIVSNCTFRGSTVKLKTVGLQDCRFNNINDVNISSPITDADFHSDLEQLSLTPELYPALFTNKTKDVYVKVELDGTKTILVVSIFDDVFFSGMIVMHSGTVDIPLGWAICDGTQGTPNLIGRFIKAVGSIDEIGDNPSELNENNELTLTQEHLPKHSHPHKEHTHSLDGNISGTTGSSGDLTVALDYSDYNWGIEGVTKTFVTSVAGEGVTTESGTVDGVSNIKTQGGNATGGSHTHSISLDTDGGASLSSIKSLEEELVDSEWPNNPIKIEPRSYSLIFIMKL